MSPFYVRKRTAGERDRFRSELLWGVFDRCTEEEKLTSAWASRDAAREAARQLNREEP